MRFILKTHTDPFYLMNFLWLMFALPISLFGQETGQAIFRKIFQAGAATSNITPKIGSSVNGGFQDRMAMNIHDEMHARGLVLDDGQNLLALVVLDLCMVSREVLDKAKVRAREFTGIPVENMLMSGTQTHTAGTACATRQSEPNPSYLEFLSERAADAVIRAYHNRRPAKIGWGIGHEPSQVFHRRWKMKPGTPMPNPFGGQDQVKMNPGVGNPNLLDPAGPIDPEVPVLSLKTSDGHPIALLANYSLHYVGGTGPGDISADYYGIFARRIGELLRADQKEGLPPFVGVMSNGSSGGINNIHWAGDKADPKPPYAQMQLVANTLAAEAFKTEQQIDYRDWVSLASLQEEISLGVRRPNEREVQRVEDIILKSKGEVLKTPEESYARETLFMKDYPAKVPVILQSFRIGDLAITAILAEAFVEVCLELKQKNPFQPSFTIGLADGYNGYLPTPEHHRLGGYETWLARSSYLEVDASRKITGTLLAQLNQLQAEKDKLFELSDQEKSEGFEVLFDGKSLDKWRGNTTGYVVEDGVLVIYPERGGKGDLFTEKEFSDFIFRFEFKLTPGANNGLGIRAPLEGVAAFEGIELQIIDNTAEMYKNLEDYQYHGSVYGVMPAKQGYLKPVGEWNYQEVVVKGPPIKVILNDKVILDGNIDEASKNGTLDGKEHPGLKRKKGHIGFLGHGDVVSFKNIRIKDLSKNK